VWIIFPSMAAAAAVGSKQTDVSADVTAAPVEPKKAAAVAGGDVGAVGVRGRPAPRECPYDVDLEARFPSVYCGLYIYGGRSRAGIVTTCMLTASDVNTMTKEALARTIKRFAVSREFGVQFDGGVHSIVVDDAQEILPDVLANLFALSTSTPLSTGRVMSIQSRIQLNYDCHLPRNPAFPLVPPPATHPPTPSPQPPRPPVIARNE
jgi:hypothetical protein